MSISDNFSKLSCNLNAQVTFVEKTQLKIVNFQNYKCGNVIPLGSDKALKGTVANWALAAFYEGLLKIALTVPLGLFCLFLELEEGELPASNPNCLRKSRYEDWFKGILSVFHFVNLSLEFDIGCCSFDWQDLNHIPTAGGGLPQKIF